MDNLVYLPGDEAEKNTPLGRYLPPFPNGTAAAFLEQHTHQHGSVPAAWILDPFGASPALAIEIASLGNRTLVAVNNPITRFLLEMAANPPATVDLNSALAELAAAYKGSERLETHLQSLYLTTCFRCQQDVPAEAFIWDRASNTLTARIYHCSCGESGEYPATEADQKRAAGMAATDSLHRARALERVAAPNDPDRLHAEEALECYLPRAVYALITIINKLDGLSLSPERRRALLALVLNACDEGSTLWPYPPERPRPKLLTRPTHFLEKNIWQTLEHGILLWSDHGKSIPLAIWPEVPGEAGGLCLFEGPMRSLTPHLRDLSISAVVTALPRPNQDFWTLSALWAGWLWGQEAAAPFKPVLRRRRYDWNWHATALHATLTNFAEQIPLNTPFFAILPELESGFLSAALLAAAGAGLELSGLALRTRHDPAQMTWHRRAFSHDEKEPPALDREAVHQAMRQVLLERSEPLPYLFLHAAGLVALASGHSLHWQPEALSLIHAPLQEALDGSEFIHHSESKNPESGLWALTEWDQSIEPLADRVEVAVVRYLQQNSSCSLRELEISLNAEFPGLLTPSLGLIRVMLASYAVETDGQWTLRPEDSPQARRADLEVVTQALVALGSRLGYTLQREEKGLRLVRWLENGQILYTFTLLASAVVGRLLRQNPAPPANSYLVIPGGRASLLAAKLERDLALRTVAGRWRILKFRHVRRMEGLVGLTREHFERESLGDPIEPPEQMKLF